MHASRQRQLDYMLKVKTTGNQFQFFLGQWVYYGNEYGNWGCCHGFLSKLKMKPYEIEIKNNPQDIHHEGNKISNFKRKILREIKIKCKI